jgi:hypothetical protein
MRCNIQFKGRRLYVPVPPVTIRDPLALIVTGGASITRQISYKEPQ